MPRSAKTKNAIRKLQEANRNLSIFLAQDTNQTIVSLYAEMKDEIESAEANLKEAAKEDAGSDQDDKSLLGFEGKDFDFVLSPTRSVDIDKLIALIGRPAYNELVAAKEPKILVSDIESQLKLGKLKSDAAKAIKVENYSCTITYKG